MHALSNSAASALPLDGIRVIDLSRVLAGPLCGAMLGDMGADVIKVEDVHAGDESRAWAPQKDGESASYVVNNRNKRAIALDLKSPEGAKILRELVRGADVLVENFRTGAMEDFGLGYDVLAADNPRLIYCSIAAFGRSGPRADAAGYEALLQAFSGIMSITGERDAAPVRCGVSVLDIMTGTLCGFGVVNALLQRQKTGSGQRVDGSLFDTALGLLNFQAQNYLLTGVIPQALGSAHPSLVPYRNFLCRDGQWAFIAAGNDRLWRRLAGALNLQPLMDDPRFASNVARVSNRIELEAALASAIAEFDRDALLERLQEADVPASPVNTIDQVMRDPQMASRPTLKKMAHPGLGEIDVVGMPLAFSGMQPAIRRHSPRHGEQTGELLLELGYTQTHIDDLRDRGVVR